MGDNDTTHDGGNAVRSHLEQLGDASGCTDAWMYLSRYRRERSDGDLGPRSG